MDTICPPGSQILDPAEGFNYFVAILEAGSISEAARVLDVPRATLSRRLGELEASLGVQLIHRSTRRLSPTAAGEELYRRTRKILQDAVEAREAVRRLDGVPRGRLRVAVPPSMGASLEPALSDYMQRYPETQVEIRAGSRFVDLISEGIDVAVRAGQVDDPQLVVHQVSHTDVFPVAAPEYLRRYGLPKNPEALQQHQCLVDCEKGDIPRRFWPLKDGGKVAIAGRLTSNDLGVLLAMAKRGWGLALLPLAVSGEALASGELVEVLRAQVGHETPLSLVHTSKEFVDPKIRAFIELATPYLENTLRGH